MTSRDDILKKIKANKPTEGPALPDIPDFERIDDRIEQFKRSAKVVGTKVLNGPKDEIFGTLFEQFDNPEVICSTIPAFKTTRDYKTITDPHEFSDVDLAIIKGELGVAENGAIWVSEEQIVHRVLPFITQHLAIVLEKKAIVENLHLAYKALKLRTPGYGVFISGPSKTADIEQSLVKGAHGPRSLVVALV